MVLSLRMQTAPVETKTLRAQKERQNDISERELLKLSFSSGIELSIDVSHDYLAPLSDPELESLASHIRDYVEAPTIRFREDMTHSERRAFLARVAKDNPLLHRWLESNRLRYNNLLGVAGLPLIHQEALQRVPMAGMIFRQVVAAIPHNAGIYDELDLSQQVGVTKEVTRGLKAIYEELSKADKRKVVAPAPSVMKV